MNSNKYIALYNLGLINSMKWKFALLKKSTEEQLWVKDLQNKYIAAFGYVN